MQHDLFKPEEDLEMHWKIVDIRYGKKSWNAQNKNWMVDVEFIHTVPLNWNGPEVSDKLPWED